MFRPRPNVLLKSLSGNVRSVALSLNYIVCVSAFNSNYKSLPLLKIGVILLAKSLCKVL
jgi:hypothetical protein